MKYSYVDRPDKDLKIGEWQLEMQFSITYYESQGSPPGQDSTRVK